MLSAFSAHTRPDKAALLVKHIPAFHAALQFAERFPNILGIRPCLTGFVFTETQNCFSVVLFLSSFSFLISLSQDLLSLYSLTHRLLSFNKTLLPFG